MTEFYNLQEKQKGICVEETLCELSLEHLLLRLFLNISLSLLSKIFSSRVAACFQFHLNKTLKIVAADVIVIWKNMYFLMTLTL